jgi:aldehyde:ferredoxin oxidoreductase
MDFKRTNYSSGAPLEEKVGYSRVVKVGPYVFVGGTTAVQPDGSVYGENDAYAQTKYILEKMIKCLEQAGAKREEVIRVKAYATDMSRAKEIGDAYAEFFKDIKPLFTMVGIAALNRPTQVVEIEIDAIIGSIKEVKKMTKVIRINPAQNQVVSEEIKDEYRLLGGRALTARIVADEVDPRCSALGVGNKIILAPGLLSGTKAPSSGRLSIGGKSPLTGTIKESNVGGTAGHKLARLGYKAIIIEGNPTDKTFVITISKKGILLLEAPELAEQGNYQTAQMLRTKYGEKAAIISIGPAGERGYTAASIAVTDMDGNPSRHAARGGLGAVLGSKGIKAIVIIDDASLLTTSDDFNQAAKKLAEALIKNPVSGQALPAMGTAVLVNMVNESGALPTRNFRYGRFDNAAAISGEQLAETAAQRGGKCGHACLPGCVIRCSNVYVNAEGQHITSGLEYETIVMLGSNCGIADLDFIAEMDRFCDDFGLDTIETGCTIGVAMEAGIIPFGSTDGMLDLTRQIAAGTALGKILGQGAAVAGKVLGVERVPAVKGQGIPAYDPRAIKGNGVTYATSPMGADHTCGNALGHPAVNPISPEGQVQVSAELQTVCAAIDATGLCLFTFFAIGENPGQNLGYVADMISSLYDVCWQGNNVIGLGQQTLAIERRYNREAGFTSAHDRLPEFFYTEPLAPHNTVFDVPEEEIKKIS